ncbi:SOS response-associated peptidase family protein [Brevibacillus agri]|uniref:SOS response-associated peptidase family protein n=1 Tax=Brevibacillus agri TaxID=51101 RepID=UPI0035E3C2C4
MSHLHDLTTRPNEIVADIHDRMPVILWREEESIWLDREKYDADYLLLSLYLGDRRLFFMDSFRYV